MTPHPTASWAVGLLPGESAIIQACARAILRGNRREALRLAGELDRNVPDAARKAHIAAQARARRAGKRPPPLGSFFEPEAQARGMGILACIEVDAPALMVRGWAVPNQAEVPGLARAGLARVGMRRGVPDVEVQQMTRGWFVEWKWPSKNAKCSEDQIAFIEDAWDRGVPAYVVWSVVDWVWVLLCELRDVRARGELRDPRRRVRG